MNTRWFDRTIYGGAWKQILLLFIVAAFLIGLAWASVCIWGKKALGPEQESTTEVVVDAVDGVQGDASDADIWTALWNVYNNFVDSGNQIAVNRDDRGLALIISFFGTLVFGGLLISTISNIMERRVENSRNGLIHYSLSGHIVIVGADPMLPCLIRQLCKRYKNCKIVVQTSKEVNDVRMKLYAELTHKEEKRVILNYARRDSIEELKRLHIAKAERVYILGDSGELDDVEYYHDSMNVDCLRLIGQLCKEAKRKKPLICYVLFEYQSTYSVFQFSDIDKELKEFIDVHPFNFYESWAQKIWIGNDLSMFECHQSEQARGLKVEDVTRKCLTEKEKARIKYKPLDYEPIDYDSEKYVHLVIVGMSRMGTALAVEAAHIAHFPNFIRDKKKKTRITFIDVNAKHEMNVFKQAYCHLFDVSYYSYLDAETGKDTQYIPCEKYRYLGDFIDIEWQFVQGAIESPEVRSLMEQWSKDKNTLMTVAICLNLTHHSIATAMYLPEAIRTGNIPVLVQQRITSSIIENLAGMSLEKEEQMLQRFKNLYPFGMLADCIDLDMEMEEYAKRVNYVYDQCYKKEPERQLSPGQEKLDEVWNELKRCKKIVKQWSNMYHANSIPTKLRSLGYKKEGKAGLYPSVRSLVDGKVELLAKVEHNRWNVEELLLGYRPVTKEEQEEIEQNYDVKKVKRDNEFVHYDIREYDDLRNHIEDNDIIISKCIPFIIKVEEEILPADLDPSLDKKQK